MAIRLEEPVSVFDSDGLWNEWEITLRFRDKLMGGIPKDPKVIEGWILSQAGVKKKWEVTQMLRRTLMELDPELVLATDAPLETLLELSSAMAANKNTVGFKRDEFGLYLEERKVKAMLKEVTNILFAGDKWGKTRKGPKNYLAERVFVDPAKLRFDRDEPDGIELIIGRVNGPQGPRSVLAYHEYVERVEVQFHMKAVNGSMTKPDKNADEDPWREMWVLAQENGLGALRSQGHGKFDVVQFDKLS